MMIIKPSITFVTADSDGELSGHTGTIVVAMTGNASYPAPSPTLALVNDAHAAFELARANAAGGGSKFTALKNAKRAELVALLRLLASYVGVACGGDLATLLSSGFPIQKPSRTPIGVLPAPTTPTVGQGSRSGEIDGSTSPLHGAGTYNWRVALASAPTVYLQQVQTTKARVTFAGLTPGQVYVVDVNAVGSAGPSDYSMAATGLMVI